MNKIHKNLEYNELYNFLLRKIKIYLEIYKRLKT